MIDVDRPLELASVRLDINMHLNTLLNITATGTVRGISYTEVLTLIDEFIQHDRTPNGATPMKRGCPRLTVCLASQHAMTDDIRTKERRCGVKR